MTAEIEPTPLNIEGIAHRRTREDWLLDAIEALRPRFRQVGMPLPEMIRVSVGFGYGARAENGQILGQTWASWASGDNVSQVFISPEMDDAARVLDVLIHELIHVADDNRSGHRGAFKTAAVALGLTGPMTATTAGDALADEMFLLATELGAYPHTRLQPKTARVETPVGPGGESVPAPRPSSGPKPQGTRMRKLVCPEHGYTVRTTAKWIEYGLPKCPCGRDLEVS